MNKVIEDFTVYATGHNGSAYWRLSYEHDGVTVESTLMRDWEINEVIKMWKANELLGSFGIGTVLSESAIAHFKREPYEGQP